jgi:hypothetical protein
LFKYLAILDQSDVDDKEGEALEAQQQSGILDGGSKAGYYFLTEKQMADSDAHVPLLLCQEEEDDDCVRELYRDGDDSDCDFEYASSVAVSDDGSQITIVVA